MKKIMVALFTLILLIPSNQVSVYAETKNPVAKIQGREIFLSDEIEMALEDFKKYLDKYERYKYEAYGKEEGLKVLQAEMDDFIELEIREFIEGKVMKEKMKEEGFQGEIKDFLRGKVNISDGEVEDYMAKNKDKTNKISHIYWRYDTREDAENLYKKLQDKELFKEIAESKINHKSVDNRTYLDEFKRRQMEHKINKAYLPTSTNKDSLYSEDSFVEDWDKDYGRDEISKLEKQELQKLSPGENSKVIEVENQGYFIFAILEEKNMTKEEVKIQLEAREIDRVKDDIIKSFNIEYFYPVIKINGDMEMDGKIKIARVNGKDLYADRVKLIGFNNFEGKHKEKQIKNIIDEEIRRHLIEEKILEEGLEKPGKTRNVIPEYIKRLSETIDIKDEEIDEYIKNKGGETFKLLAYTITYENPFEVEDNKDLSQEEREKKYQDRVKLLYDDLKNDHKAYRLLKLMESGNEGYYEASKEELGLLASYSPEKDFRISGMTNYLSTELGDMIKINPKFADEFEKLRGLDLKSITQPEKNLANDYISTVILEKTDRLDDIKEEIVDNLKFEKINQILDKMVEEADIIYY